jgi:hypothetical protein
MKKNELLFGLLIVVGIVFFLKIIGPLLSMVINFGVFAIIAAVIYSFINPTFKARALGFLSFLKNKIFK